jgi:hypothetical protein
VTTQDRAVQPDLQRFVAKLWTRRSTRSRAATSPCSPSPTS